MIAGNAKLSLLFVSLTVFGYISSVRGNADGAPTDACEDMLPQHGAPAQTKESPYTLTPNRKSVKAGESITLTLAAKDVTKFKGFLVQARGSANHPIGSFMPLPASKSNSEFKGKWKLISCPKGPANVSGVYNILYNNRTNTRARIPLYACTRFEKRVSIKLYIETDRHLKSSIKT